jgi:acyl-CoA thioesterase FadM
MSDFSKNNPAINMARVKIDFPEHFCFSTIVDVRITDLNYGGHMGNDTFLSIAHEARVRFLKKIGFESEGAGPGGIGIIMGDAAIIYKGEVRYGDTLAVDMAVGDFSRVGFDIFYRLTARNQGTVVALIKTGIIGYDYQSGRVMSIPDAVIENINDLGTL